MVSNLNQFTNHCFLTHPKRWKSLSPSPLSLFSVVALENKFQQSPTLKTLHSKSQRDKFPSHPFIRKHLVLLGRAVLRQMHLRAGRPPTAFFHGLKK
jgi:hypothetical protein